MNTSRLNALFLKLFYLAAIMTGLDQAYSQALAQQPVGTPPPAKERFQTSTDLIIPWRDGNCTALIRERGNGSGCYTVTASQYVSRTFATLYTADGEVWHTLDLNHKSDLYFGKLPKEEFAPFATPGLKSVPPTTLVLRISGESDHWYRVIVNEDKVNVAYVLKADPDWFKTTFEYRLIRRKVLYPTVDQPPLLDAPNGKAIPETELMKFEIVDFIKLDKPDGEWAFVEGTDGSKTYKGWLRWRNGREFLVDCWFAIKDPGW